MMELAALALQQGSDGAMPSNEERLNATHMAYLAQMVEPQCEPKLGRVGGAAHLQVAVRICNLYM